MNMADPTGPKSDRIHLETAESTVTEPSAKVEKVDTVHNDEAVIVLASYDGDQTWSKEEEKKLLRKIDRRMLPILVCTFGLTFYDKVLLAHAVSKILLCKVLRFLQELKSRGNIKWAAD